MKSLMLQWQGILIDVRLDGKQTIAIPKRKYALLKGAMNWVNAIIPIMQMGRILFGFAKSTTTCFIIIIAE